MTRIGSEPGERLITTVRRRIGTGRAPGSVLIAVAAWLLALIGGGALFVSFSAAQYAYILTVRRQDAASAIEALLLDLLMIVFTLLALGLSRAGQPSRTRTGPEGAARARDAPRRTQPPRRRPRRPPLHVTGRGCAGGWPRRHPRRRAAGTATQTTGGRTRERP